MAGQVNHGEALDLYVNGNHEGLASHTIKINSLTHGSTWWPAGNETVGEGSDLVRFGEFIAHAQFGNSEIGISYWLKRQQGAILPFPMQGIISDISLSPEQARAVAAAISTAMKAMVITGGPGTGKTTVCKAIIASLVSAGVSERDIGLCAPTGKAAKRLTVATGKKAYTCHRLLGCTSEDIFLYNEDHPLPYLYLICDETSMLDVVIAWCLIRALRHDCRLIFVGDPNQLPSVGPGNFLRDIIRILPVFELNHVHRTEKDGPIGLAAQKILSGRIPNKEENGLGCGFYIARVTNDHLARVVEHRVRIMSIMLNCNPEEIRIMTPFNDWCDYLNKELNSALLNSKCYICKGKKFVGELKGMCLACRGKGKSPIPLGMRHETNPSTLLYSRFPVVFKKNEKNTGLCNGDIGYLNSETGYVEFEDWAGDIVKKKFCNDSTIMRLATSQTGHAMQGDEGRGVLVVVPNCSYTNHIGRDWFYTAVTRGKEIVTVVDAGQMDEVIARSGQSNIRRTMIVPITRSL